MRPLVHKTYNTKHKQDPPKDLQPGTHQKENFVFYEYQGNAKATAIRNILILTKLKFSIWFKITAIVLFTSFF